MVIHSILFKLRCGRTRKRISISSHACKWVLLIRTKTMTGIISTSWSRKYAEDLAEFPQDSMMIGFSHKEQVVLSYMSVESMHNHNDQRSSKVALHFKLDNYQTIPYQNSKNSLWTCLNRTRSSSCWTSRCQ